MDRCDTLPSPPPELNAIACRRCRNKKLRCDREKPACKRCRQISVSCLYDPRKPRERVPVLRPGQATESGTCRSNANESAIQSSRIPKIPDHLGTLENAVRGGAGSLRRQDSVGNRNARPTDLKGFKFHADPAESIIDEKVFIPTEKAVLWLQALYENQSTMGLLLPIGKDFMLTIPSLLDNPYIQIDVRVLILYYGAVHQGMLLTPDIDKSKRSEYSIFLYRKALQHMENWQLQGQLSELNLHVAFWMAYETFSQLDIDLSYRLHSYACHVARSLGLFHLDAEDPPTSSAAALSPLLPKGGIWSENMDALYRDVHRIYFWQILVADDCFFCHHLYRPGSIELGTWKVDLPDLSAYQTLSNSKRDTQVHYEVSMQLSRISLRFSEIKSDGNFSNASDQADIMDLVLETVSVLSEWRIVSAAGQEHMLSQVSSKIIALLYTKLIWRATLMIISFLRIHPRSSVWPTDRGRKLEHEAARRSIRAMERLFELDQDGLCGNLGYLKSFITPCLGVIFSNILTTDAEEIAMSGLPLTVWVEMVVKKFVNERSELLSMQLFLRTLNHFSRLALREKLSSGPQGLQYRDGQGALPYERLWRNTDEIFGVPGQTTGSNSHPSRTSTIGSLDEEETIFLAKYSIDVDQLHNDPCQAILSLEKSLLTEPDPHQRWWTFEL